MTTINFRAFSSPFKRNPVPISSYSPFCLPVPAPLQPQRSTGHLSVSMNLLFWTFYINEASNRRFSVAAFFFFFLLSMFSRFVPVVECISNFLNFFLQGQAGGREELHTHTQKPVS